MVHLKEREAAPLETRPPRLVWTVALLVGLLVLAHGCHGPDEDHELFAPRMWGHVAHRDGAREVPFSARAALPDEGDSTASTARALNGTFAEMHPFRADRDSPRSRD